jgi:uncharacterized membrane protein
MVPLICLITVFVALRLVGLGVPWFTDWQHALRGALGAMFLLTASAHWGKGRSDLLRMVPERLGNAGMWVTLTGIAEIGIAAGLQVPRLSLASGAFAILMLCCLFPANVKAAREELTIRGRRALAAGPRLLIQLVFIGALAAAVWRR